jgi:hypothetical protein
MATCTYPCSSRATSASTASPAGKLRQQHPDDTQQLEDVVRVPAYAVDLPGSFTQLTPANSAQATDDAVQAQRRGGPRASRGTYAVEAGPYRSAA